MMDLIDGSEFKVIDDMGGLKTALHWSFLAGIDFAQENPEAASYRIDEQKANRKIDAAFKEFLREDAESLLEEAVLHSTDYGVRRAALIWADKNGKTESHV